MAPWLSGSSDSLVRSRSRVQIPQVPISYFISYFSGSWNILSGLFFLLILSSPYSYRITYCVAYKAFHHSVEHEAGDDQQGNQSGDDFAEVEAIVGMRGIAHIVPFFNRWVQFDPAAHFSSNLCLLIKTNSKWDY